MLSRRLLLCTRCLRCAQRSSTAAAGASANLLVSPSFECSPLSLWTPIVSANNVTGQRRLLCTSAASKYSGEELQPGPVMIQRIVTELEAGGMKLLVPFNDKIAMQSVCVPFRSLIDAGVEPAFLVDLCIQQADFFRALVTKGRGSLEIIRTIATTCSCSFEESVRLFSCFPEELLAVGAGHAQECLEIIIDCGVQPGRSLEDVVFSCPAVLFARNVTEIRALVDTASSFFSRPQIERLVTQTPQILLCNITDLESKYEYIYFRMCMEGEEFLDCKCWVDLPLEDIIMRHEFLMKTGNYATPDPKRPQLKKGNPRLSAILDAPETTFAQKLAGVSAEEWQVYKELSEKLRKQSEFEFPFERIKPSMRKAFERRLKHAEEAGPYKFESGTRGH